MTPPLLLLALLGGAAAALVLRGRAVKGYGLSYDFVPRTRYRFEGTVHVQPQDDPKAWALALLRDAMGDDAAAIEMTGPMTWSGTATFTKDWLDPRFRSFSGWEAGECKGPQCVIRTIRWTKVEPH